MRIWGLLLFVSVLMGFNAFGQDVVGSGKIPSTYDRNSITLMYAQFASENHSSELLSKINNISFSDKYYNNNLESIPFTPSFSRGIQGLSDDLKQHLNTQTVGRQILSKWFARQSDGSMSMDLVFERGMFNATDAAYIKAQATKLGNAVLKDYGNRLIARSYVLVLDFQSIATMQEAKIKGMKGWKATVTGYLYKISFTDEIQNSLYEAWIYPEDTPEVKAEKNQKFNSLNVPVEFVTKSTVYVTASQASEDSQLGKFLKPKTEDQLLMELVQKAYDETLYNLEKAHEDFMVKTTIHQVRPIRAKIGKKEGLKCDSRYFAYEYVYDEKTNSAKPVRRGVIRATSRIADNRQVAAGQTETSKFYQTAGRKLRTGYLLRQQNDIGVELTAGYEAGEVGGAYARIDLRLGRYIGIKSLFFMLEGGLQSKEYYDNYVTFSKQDIFFYRYGAGLAKGLMLTRNIELRPYVAFGQEVATHEDWKESGGDLKVLYAKGGANLALNLKHNFQLVGGVGFYAFVSDPENDDEVESVGEKSWNEYFEGREGAAAMLGLKIMF
ncbi:MAG: hypothetical protein H6536_08630 [Bacteroidales bacterium]|nr:hypothetical protein [Bacteroidales bacterium]